MSGIVLPPGVTVASHAPLLYTPEFWDPRKAYAWYSPDIEGAFLEGVKFRLENHFKTLQQLKDAGLAINLLMITDIQGDFRPGGRLPVLGTDDVMMRLAARILNGVFTGYYGDIIYSKDGHVPWHISYGSRWMTERGVPFDLRIHKAAVLSLEDDMRGRALFRATCFDPQDGSPIDMGYVQSMVNALDSVAYWDHLQKTGQGPIWLFANHCKIDTDGTNLHPFLSEILAFVEGFRGIEPLPLFKGHIRDTDWFGPLEPCRPDSTHPQGGFQMPIIDRFMATRGRNEFVGVAEDFCEHHMERQAVDRLNGTPHLRRLAFASDGTAAIVHNAPHVLAFHQKAAAQGIQFFKLGDPFDPTGRSYQDIV